MILRLICACILLQCILAKECRISFNIDDSKRVTLTSIDYNKIKTYSNDTHFMEDVELRFSGHIVNLLMGDEDMDIDSVITTQIMRTKTKEPESFDGYEVDVLSQQNNLADVHITNEMARKIIEGTEECEKHNLNEEISTPTKRLKRSTGSVLDDLLNTSMKNILQLIMSEASTILTTFKTEEDISKFVTKEVLDMLIAKIKTHFVKENNGLVEIPTLNLTSDDRHYFYADSGTFWNLTDIKRDHEYDTNHDKVNKLYNLYTIFGIEEGHVQYSYAAKYILGTKGDINMLIHNLKIEFEMELNYVRSPCLLFVRRVHVDFSDIELQVSGFGLLNKPVAYLLRREALKHKDYLIQQIDIQLQTLLQDTFDTNFECERYKFIFLPDVPTIIAGIGTMLTG